MRFRAAAADRALLVEIAWVLAGVALISVLFLRTYEQPAVPVALSISADAKGLRESWAGVYVGDEKIGYSLSREAPREDGGRLLQERTQLRLRLLGHRNDLTLDTDVAVAASGRIETLLAHVKTEVQGVPVTLRAEGKARGERGMSLDLFQAGEKVTTMELDDVPALPATLYRAVAERHPQPGERLVLPWFDPLSLGRSEATITVSGLEAATTPEGESVQALRLSVDHGGRVLDALVSADGRRLLEKEASGGLGMQVRAETREDALEKGWPADSEDAVDLVALSSVPVDRRLPGGGRSLRRLVLRVDGAPTAYELLARFHGAAWDAGAHTLTLAVPDPFAEPSYALPSQDRELRIFLRPTAFAPSEHPDIRRTAGQIVGDDLDGLLASRKLLAWVHDSIAKVPVAGVPSALEVLRSRRGDCNEHTTLYTALARAVGIPTRMAAGIVYTESIFEDGAFYYHAWPEVFLGARWVPLDPTFGQFPADATHVKLVEGELDRQLELMGVIGRLSLHVVDAG
jgi:transglutaminase-like putative cysteine protease